MQPGFVRADFVSEWDGTTQVVTKCDVNFNTGEIKNIEQSDKQVQGCLTAEYVVFGDREEDVCKNCHGWLLKTVSVPDDVGNGMHEEQECHNPDCECEEYVNE